MLGYRSLPSLQKRKSLPNQQEAYKTRQTSIVKPGSWLKFFWLKWGHWAEHAQRTKAAI
jgi:hypothetical protein